MKLLSCCTPKHVRLALGLNHPPLPGRALVVEYHDPDCPTGWRKVRILFALSQMARALGHLVCLSELAAFRAGGAHA